MAVTVSGASVPGINFSGILSNTIMYSVSGTVSGGAEAGVTVSLSPGGVSAITDASGNYVFTGITNGGYTVTPSLSGYTFTPVNASVTVNGANVTGVNFTTPVPTLAVGKLLYPCPTAECSQNLATSVITVLWGGYQCPFGGCSTVYPDTLVPSRIGGKVASQGSNMDGIHLLSLAGLTDTQVIFAQINLTDNAADNCSSWAEGSFDLTPNADWVVISSRCSPVGFPEKSDIFLVKTDGMMGKVRVTNDVAADSQPVIGGVDATTGYVTVLFVRNGIEIWKQVVDPAHDLLIGPATLEAINVVVGTRSMSVNASYTHLAFMKKVGGVSHIFVVPLAGGPEVDLGIGSDPYWSLDGSNLILHTANNALWAMNPDGTGKMSVPIPSNLQYGLGKVVFGPAGY